jgi:YidC/Oxa1 family membrane protein insertase
MQTLLFAVVIFLGFNMYNQWKNPSTTTGPQAAEIRGQMLYYAEKMNLDQVTKLKTNYERTLTSEFDAKTKSAPINSQKVFQEDLDAKKLEAEIVVADVQLKTAFNRSDYNIAQTAYTSLKNLEKTNRTKAIWDREFQVSPNKQYPRTSVTPRVLLAEVTKLASQLGKDTPVWGFFPGYQVVDFLVNLTGANPHYSYWLAALFMAIVVRGVIYKLFQKQLMWGRQMAQLTPLTAELKEKYSGPELQTQIMGLYKEYGINPMAGCLPVVVQMPFFLMIYSSMLHYRFEFEKGLFLWICPAGAERFPGIIARNLGDRDYPLIVLYGISMVVTQLLTPVSDPTNAKQQRLMGLSMTLMFGVMMFFWPIPSAFVLYWIFLNILATLQSWRAYRLPPPPLVKVNAPGGGVFPTSGAPKPVARFGSTGAPKVHRPKKKK